MSDESHGWHFPPLHSGRDECEHGSLRRSCEICERDVEIARLRAVVDAAEEEIARIREECLDNYHRSSFDEGELSAVEQIQRAISDKLRALDGEP